MIKSVVRWFPAVHAGIFVLSLLWFITAPAWQNVGIARNPYFAPLTLVVLIGIAATSIAFILAFRQAVAPEVIKHRHRVVISACIVLIGAIALLVPFDNLPTALWLIVTAVSGGVLYMHWFGVEGAPSRGWVWFALVMIVAVIGVRLAALSAHPPVNMADEGWDYSWALHHLRTGRLEDTIMFGTLPGIKPPNYYLLVSAWLGAVGGGLWEMRLFSLLMSGIMIALTMGAAQRIWGGRAGLWAGLLMLAMQPVLYAARFRHDVGLGIAIALSIWLYAEATQRRALPLHLLSGLAVALGAQAHFHAVFFGPALLIAFYAPTLWQRWRNERRLYVGDVAAFAVGGLMGAALFVLDRSYLVSSSGISYVSTQINIATIPEYILRHALVLGTSYPLESLLVVLGIAAAFHRRRARDLTIALSVILCQIAIGAEVVLADHYLVPLAPLYALAILGGVDVVLEYLGTHWAALRHGHVVALALVVLAMGLVTTAPGLRYTASGAPVAASQPPASAWIRENVPPSAVVVAENYHYFWLNDYRFASSWISRYRTLTQPELYPDAASTWSDIDVDVFVIDPADTSERDLGQLRDGYLAENGFSLRATAGSAEIYVRQRSE